MTFPGVILAGGRAQRMGGGDKGLLRLGKCCLFDHVITRLAPQCAPLAISANGDPARLARFGLPVLRDTAGGHPGPLAGVLAGLDWAAGLGASHLVTVAADTPFFPANLAVRLSAAGDAPIVLAGTPGPDGPLRHPTFGLWSVALRDDLRQALAEGTRKVTAWADRHGATTAVFAATPADPFFNINTPADLALAQTLLKTAP
jgi:molybdopterin-guanine dinucleotide biosynthesis protein A